MAEPPHPDEGADLGEEAEPSTATIIVTTAGARQPQAAGWVILDIRIRSHRPLSVDRP
jgi:hypothetical protein